VNTQKSKKLMFGCLVSGRLIQTNLQQGDANRFLSSIEKANQITFLTVFLLGTVALPEGYGASIYFGWPPYQNWKYLGSLTNAKPSAVYRLRSKQSNHGIDVDMDQFDENIVAQIGISIEPMETIEQRMQETLNVNTTSVSTADMQEFATKMCQNLYNYVLSFANQGHIPISTIDKWYENFQRKVKNDPSFMQS